MSDAPGDDVKDYLLATSDFGKGMQDDIKMYDTRNRLNNVRFRQMLDPKPKDIFERLTFHVQNPIISSLLKELDIGKKDITNTLIQKAPNLVDIEIHLRLDGFFFFLNQFKFSTATCTSSLTRSTTITTTSTT